MSIAPNRPETVVPADNVPGPPQGQWTYDDYAALPDDGNRYEVINGVLYIMPSPGEAHQSASNLIATYLTIHIQFIGLGRVYSASFDVKLGLRDTVQPDVLVILKPNKDVITRKNIDGTPDVVIEIASPGTARYDRRTKMDAYARAGVNEFWIVDPVKQNVELLVLEQSNYRSLGIFSGQQTLPSPAIANLPIQVQQFFE